MSPTVREIAQWVNGEISGNPELAVDGVAGLAEAGPTELSFLANPKYAPLLSKTRAAAVIVSAEEHHEAACALIRVRNPDLAFATAVERLLPPPPQPAPGIHPSAVVAASAQLGENVAVGPCAVVESGAVVGAGSVLHAGTYVGQDARVGRDCVLHPGSVLYHRVELGDRVVVHANAVIGSDGFGYAWDGQQHRKIPQVGIVVVEDDVEIGACTTIDRARFGRTVIGRGTKLDNLVQIAHNVRLGAHCAFAAQVGISGSTTIGSGVLAGGQSGAVGHVEVGPGAVLSAKSGITKSVPGGRHYSGYPARLHREQLEEWAGVKALPRMRNKIKDLEDRLAHLEQRLRQGETTNSEDETRT